MLSAVIRKLVEDYPQRLRMDAGEIPISRLPEADEVEGMLKLPPQSLDQLARILVRHQRVFFISHRGWYDPNAQAARSLTILDGLLSGSGGAHLFYLGKDCNSRGAAAQTASFRRDQSASPEVIFVVGADPLGTAIPDSILEQRLRDCERLIVFDTYLTRTAGAAAAVFPLPAFTEKDGSYLAANHLEQSGKAALAPPPSVMQPWPRARSSILNPPRRPLLRPHRSRRQGNWPPLYPPLLKRSPGIGLF
jgi:anaerobic selenocysteine-containing dehydrogenase